jgi:hypothetical protein
MPPYRRSLRRKSGASSRHRNLNDAVQRAVEGLLPKILQTIMQHVHPVVNNSSSTPSSHPTPPSSPPRTPTHHSSPSQLSTPPTIDTVNDTIVRPTIDISTWLARFMKQKPRSFSSAATPIEAQNWITHVEKIFEVLGVGDEFKARLAAYKLEDDAQSWWGTIKHARGGDSFAATLPWNDFKTLFFQQYFPSAYRGEYAREYASIKQREDEPMSEFMARFTRLASFLGPDAGSPVVQANKLNRGSKCGSKFGDSEQEYEVAV